MAAHRLVGVALLAAGLPRAAAAQEAARPEPGAPRSAASEEGSAGVDDAPARPRPTSICIDQEIADRLAVKRKRRKVVDCLFVKQARHELSLLGGYYVSDLFSSTYSLGGAYTFHMTESSAVEMNVAFTHANAEVIRAIEEERMEVLDDEFAQVKFFESLLLWSPVYGKLRVGSSIMRFDIHLDAGVGVVDSPTSRGAAGVGGLGLKLFAGQALAFRLDARDHVFRQELLDESFIVNDLSITLGLSVFFPFRN